MRDVRIGQQMPGGRHDDGDPRLVVRPQQGGAAGRDDVIAHLAGQIGRLRGRQDQVRRIGKGNRPAVIGAMHHGFDPACGIGRRGIDMGQPAHDRGGVMHRARNGRQHRAIIGQPHILRADGLQFRHQQALQVKLTGRAGRRGRCLVALRVDGRIADQALFQVPGEICHVGILVTVVRQPAQNGHKSAVPSSLPVGYSCARNTCAGRAASGRKAKTRPAASVAITPPSTMARAETGSKA